MDPVSGYLKSKLFVKEEVSLKSKIRLGYVSLIIFAIPVFYFDQTSAQNIGKKDVNYHIVN